MVGQNLKKHCLNKKIIIYQMPLFERIIGLFSAIVLTSIPVICLFIGVEKTFTMVILLLVMLMYSFFVFFCAFKIYICLDWNNKKIIIREFPGIKKQELPLDNLKEIKISEGIQYKNFFTIDINCVGYSKKINSWSTHPSCRLAIFNVYGRQTKRLKKFILKCQTFLTTVKPYRRLHESTKNDSCL